MPANGIPPWVAARRRLGRWLVKMRLLKPTLPYLELHLAEKNFVGRAFLEEFRRPRMPAAGGQMTFVSAAVRRTSKASGVIRMGVVEAADRRRRGTCPWGG
jgi:hypothetical protein